ncbi:transcriptional regulator [Herbaspirillum sp. CF444]|uniref:MarR family winged helix-turn-helix transcriptional regulator n=1 Tax=Herbaspirillum sp. CF444 TaxID=1144319 RepID=UPI0002727370|nr:MarR family transcriptional regulator [Herbaspirillum sp. CF444]EJL92405.1 transcriptional regulator [Herbaspirillum sp. CF444]
MKPESPPTLSEHLCFKLYSTSLKMTQLYKPLLAPLNLTYPQYLVMVVLWEEEGIGMKDLAERLHLDAGSVTPLVKRLEVNGYVIRSRNPHDERNRILTLTKAGKALRTSGMEVSRQIVSLCGISMPKADILMNNLDVLNRNIGEVLTDA